MALHEGLADGELDLVPLTEAHREGLRAACREDDAIWEIYPTSYAPDRFDATFDALLANAARLPFAIRLGGQVIGMTAYLGVDAPRGVLEIGNSYIVPRARGTGLNRRIKRLMIDHAFAEGFRRIEFKVDQRNARSQAAVAKLGAVREGVLRQERITWTGHVRDTVIFGLLRDEWQPG
ncbi:GNAT family N-acetyltransferase [Flavisphingomonas formosensis]|uniref:GNAT family N-acetyltransferase n=1 Tax=Flavisphingomonas formosensis TaxID=861534 RepID=UPI0012FCFD8C|nr:GNAT family protein [Sphingomonas formosensis]